jgi:DNA-binding transcriptional LysR family regulator
MLDLYALQVFLAAAEHENFSEAGRRLGLSQPAVSMQIRSLEESLCMDLFDRSGRHIMLTEAGHALVPMARDLINRSIHIEEIMGSLQGEVLGLLKVGCSTTVGKYILPKLLAGLRERHPLVQIVCHVTGRGLAMQMLLEGDVHVAITSLREPHKGVEYRPFLTDRIILVVPPDHPWALGSRVVKPADLMGEQFILREEDSGTRCALSDALVWHDLGLDDLNIMMTLGNSEAIAMAVQEGLGLAFVSYMVAAEPIRVGHLIPIEVEGMALEQTLYMARHTHRQATRAQTAFWELAFAPETEAIRQLTNQDPLSEEDTLTTADTAPTDRR